MIAYHEGDGILINLANSETTAKGVFFDDATMHIGADNVQDAIENLKSLLENDFSEGITTIYNAVVNKGVTPDTKSPDDIAYAISQITTHSEQYASGTFSTNQRSSDIDMGDYHWFRKVNTSEVPNYNYEEYAYTVTDDVVKDFGVTNKIRKVDATKVKDRGFAEGQQDIRDRMNSDYYVLWGGAGVTQTRNIDITDDCFLYVVSARTIQGASGGSVGTRKVFINGVLRFQGHGFVTNPFRLHPGDRVTMELSRHNDEYIFLLCYLVAWPPAEE